MSEVYQKISMTDDSGRGTLKRPNIRSSFFSPKLLALAATLLASWTLLPSSRVGAQSDKPPTFDSDILPILQAKCGACHSGSTPQAQLDLQKRQSVIAGGKSGPAIVVGSSDKSLLFEKIVSKSMPPGDEKLSDKEIGLIRLWIDKGAPPGGETNDSALKRPSSDLVGENQVLPIFQMRCVVCHGKRKQEGGLDLRTQASRLKGGKSGPSLVPGKPEESLLMKKILSGEMPPPKLLFSYAV